MTPEEINKTIAEECEWKPIAIPDGEGELQGFINNGELIPEVPDYYNDLNVIHEAELHLKNSDNHAYSCYCSNLYEEYDNFISLTSQQRCEMFLKTIGKWKES
jgi:hypothetical protein